MKKIVFALVVLLFTAPAWAQVTITATQVPGTPEVEISYVSDGNLPRAFGLDITVTDGNIVACTAAMEGECTASVMGFGIFPGTINIDDTVTPAVVVDDGTPVAPTGARGALDGLGTPGITIEMGSLYEGPNAPPSSGVLVTIEVSTSCTVNIAGNAARCGEGSEPMGVVMEDPGELPPVVYVPGVVDPWEIECFDSAHPDYAEWVAVGKPDSWCYKYQNYGDADGKCNGNDFVGYARVREEDLTILVSGWKVEDYVDEATHPWIAADFDRKLNGNDFVGYARIREEDLTILVANWKNDALIPLANPDGGGDIDLQACP